MEKEFIPYEQALALKELGFDEPCFKKSEHNKKCEEQEKPEGCQLHNLHCAYPDCIIDKTVKPIGVPTFSQAFRWFREKYNLDSFVKDLYKSTIKVGYYFGIDQYKGVEFQMDFDVWYNTYEEAELECLRKLIEIVKNER